MKFDDLKGMVLTNYDVSHDVVTLYFDLDARKFRMYHSQDCCESVTVDEVIGDWADLIGRPLLVAEEVAQKAVSSEWGDSTTWTFYKLRTIKGEVVIRWCGSSNGYYSESVDFEEVSYNA